MAKEQFCIDMENVGELKDMKRIIDEQLAKFESASIEKDMKKIRGSIGYEAANKLFDAIQDCDMIDCTKDEFTKDFDGDVKAALKDSFPDVFDAIPRGAKIYDSVARLVGVMDADWENPRENDWGERKDLMYRMKPTRNDPNEVPGWTAAQDKFNACEDDCMFGMEYGADENHMDSRDGFAKIDGRVYEFSWYNNRFSYVNLYMELGNDNRYHFVKKVDVEKLNVFNRGNGKPEKYIFTHRAFFESPIPESFKQDLVDYVGHYQKERYERELKNNEVRQTNDALFGRKETKADKAYSEEKSAALAALDGADDVIVGILERKGNNPITRVSFAKIGSKYYAIHTDGYTFSGVTEVSRNEVSLDSNFPNSEIIVAKKGSAEFDALFKRIEQFIK